MKLMDKVVLIWHGHRQARYASQSWLSRDSDAPHKRSLQPRVLLRHQYVAPDIAVVRCSVRSLPYSTNCHVWVCSETGSFSINVALLRVQRLHTTMPPCAC